MGTFDKLPGILNTVYSAADDPEQWPHALGELAGAVDAMAANLFVSVGSTSLDGITFHHGFDPETVKEYNDYYIDLDPMPEASFAFPVGEFIASRILFPGTVYTETEYYQDMLRPNGVDQTFGTTLVRSPASYAALSLMRPPGTEVLDGDEFRFYQLVIPHFQRVVEIHQRLIGSDQRAKYFEEVVDRVACGVVLVDAFGRVVHANSAARSMALESDGLSLDRDCVRGAVSDDTTALRRMVATTITTAVGEGVGCAEAILLNRPSGKRPYQVMAAPLRGRQHERCSCRALAVLFITDPETAPTTPEQLVQALYGLTPAECRVAKNLLLGTRLEDISDQHGVSLNTVRSQLRSIFDKTETRRQSELVALLMRGPVGRFFEA